MNDEQLRDELRRAFGAGYRAPHPGLADRMLADAFDRRGGAAGRRGPADRWLPAVAAASLAVLTVAVLVALSGAVRGRPAPVEPTRTSAAAPSPTPSPDAPPTVVVSASSGSGAPLQRLDWNGQPAGVFTEPGQPPPPITVAPDGSRAALFGNDGTVQIADGAGHILATTNQWSRDLRQARWADDSRHWCSLQGGALLYSVVQGGGVHVDSWTLVGPGLPSDSPHLVACSATAGRAVIVVDAGTCSGKGCAGFVDTVDLRTGTVAQNLRNPAAATFGDPVASADGRFFAESDRANDRSIVWDLTSGAVVERPAGVVQAMSGDGRVMAIVTDIMGPTIAAVTGHLIDRTSGREIWSGYDTLMNELVFRPGGEECVLAQGHDLVLVRPNGSATAVLHGDSNSYPQLYM
jgi:hypothetical protein